MPGFILFTDSIHLEKMDLECAPVLGELMEECAKMGLGAVVRVIPSAKDIGLNLIGRFHLPPELPVQTHETLSEALNALVMVFPVSQGFADGNTEGDLAGSIRTEGGRGDDGPSKT